MLFHQLNLYDFSFFFSIVVIHINTTQPENATTNPTQEVFMLKAAKKPIVDITQVIRNNITFFIIVSV